jgi:hypothetical protein
MAVRFEERMIVTTGSEVDGRAIADYLGVVRGLVVWAPTRRQRIRGRADARWEGGNNRFFWKLPRLPARTRTRRW